MEEALEEQMAKEENLEGEGETEVKMDTCFEEKVIIMGNVWLNL